MSKTRYLNPADMVNRYIFTVLAPARVSPISQYDLQFNNRPSYEPLYANQLQNTAATVNEMIEWAFQGIPFTFINELDMLEAKEIIENYLEFMAKYDIQQFNASEKLYFEKAIQFQEIMNRQVEKLEHYHSRKNPSSRKRSLLGILKSMASPIIRNR